MILIFSILAIWTPWILLSLIIIPFMTWMFTYEEKIFNNYEFKELGEESLQKVDIISSLKEIIFILNLKMDVYEILLLEYKRLKYRMLGIKVIRVLIYILFPTVIILIILSPNLTEFSGYWQIQTIISFILLILFAMYIKVDRLKRQSIPFKKWLKMIQPQIIFISNNYIIKRNLDSIKEELINLNKKIDRFKILFKPTIKIVEIIGYLTTIITTFISLFITRDMMLELIQYIISSIILFMVLLIPYFYYNVIDSKKLKHSEDIINVNTKLDLLLKRLSYIYFSKNMTSLDK